MDISFDPAKNETNLLAGRPGFAKVVDFEFETALFAVDGRKDYGETRIQALGFLGRRLHVLVFVETETGIRVISFRKANAREVRRYEEAHQS